VPLAADHNPHTLLGNSSVAKTVLHFAPRNVKFLLLTCHPAKRALATYRFRYLLRNTHVNMLIESLKVTKCPRRILCTVWE
jgi:hypothetical protein